MKLLIPLILLITVSGLFAAAPLDGVIAGASSQSYIDARNKVIIAAKKYEKTPYRYGGITSSGLDCSGLICLSFKDALGVNLPRSASGIHSWAEKISIDKAQPGDLLFFKTDNSGSITHVALYLGGRSFIHSASAGPNTGVIYSTLDEQYWARTYVGAGRAFPEAPSNAFPSGAAAADTSIAGSGNSGWKNSTSSSSSGSGNFLFGAAFALTWNGILKDGNIVRGFSSQLRLGADTSSFGLFGLELRPEYDGALGVTRLPITLSWGPSDKVRFFAGPVLSFGNASISTADGVRQYSGGTSWLGSLGVTAAPFSFQTTKGEFSPYMEAAIQNYFSNNAAMNLNADFSAFFRLSTGVRWTKQIR